MSSTVFRNITTRIICNWPLDTTKKGRDLGEFIRKKIAASFSQGESTKITDIEYWSKFSLHIENISKSKALKKYPRIYNSTATGLSAAECREIVSTEFLKFLKESADPKSK